MERDFKFDMKVDGAERRVVIEIIRFLDLPRASRELGISR